MSIINNKILILNYHVILQRQMDEKKIGKKFIFIIKYQNIYCKKPGFEMGNKKINETIVKSV